MGTSAVGPESLDVRASVARKYVVLGLLLAATLSLAYRPATLCFDCEPDYTFGRTKEINDLGWHILAFWIIAAPFLSGMLRTPVAWLVPIGITMVSVVTMHLGGVPWWDIRGNEGPILALIELPIGFTSLSLGWITGFGLVAVRKRWSTK